MQKELFIMSIEAIQKQKEHDFAVAENLSKVFPNAFEANLLPDNHFLYDAATKLLQVAMDDVNENSLIEHFCWVVDFGKYSHEYPIRVDGEIVPMETASDLWEFLNKNKNN